MADGVLITKGGQAVTAGDMLARARRDAGLSIADISTRTLINQNVIDGIEHDDYSACGGDVSARGDIAAIARALGVDSEPMVRAYEAETIRQPAESDWIAATRSSEPVADEPNEAYTPRHEGAPVAADEDTLPIMLDQPPEPATSGELPIPAPTGKLAIPAPTDEPPLSILPGEVPGPVQVPLADQRPFIWIALSGALLAVAVLGGILLIVGAAGQPTRHAIATGQHGSGARRPSGTRHSTGHTAHSRRRTRPGSAARRPSGRLLVPASIAAYGPGGTGHGDSPQLAHRALAGKASAPWHSAWYTTPHFGNLQPGTGLLLDMGRTVTITSARIALGNDHGTDLALRIGSTPNLASMRTVARADGVGGMVRLTTDRTRGRFVLVWFTKLPPDRAGTFQVSVYDIKLNGRL